MFFATRHNTDHRDHWDVLHFDTGAEDDVGTDSALSELLSLIFQQHNNSPPLHALPVVTLQTEQLSVPIVSSKGPSDATTIATRLQAAGFEGVSDSSPIATVGVVT